MITFLTEGFAIMSGPGSRSDSQLMVMISAILIRKKLGGRTFFRREPENSPLLLIVRNLQASNI